MTFKAALRLWLASHGLSEAECDKVCADRRVAFSIQIEDYSGMLSDVRTALWSLNSPAGLDARRAMDDPAEQLMLMQHLEVHSSQSSRGTGRKPNATKGTHAKSAVPTAPALSPEDALMQRICREMELTRSELKLLMHALA